MQQAYSMYKNGHIGRIHSYNSKAQAISLAIMDDVTIIISYHYMQQSFLLSVATRFNPKQAHI